MSRSIHTRRAVSQQTLYPNAEHVSLLDCWAEWTEVFYFTSVTQLFNLSRLDIRENNIVHAIAWWLIF
jgi:hypothetical protein